MLTRIIPHSRVAPKGDVWRPAKLMEIFDFVDHTPWESVIGFPSV